MRILIVHTTYKVRGGEDSVVYNEAELLRNAGNEVELLLFSNNDKTALNVAQLPFSITSYRNTLQKIREFKPDVMHVHNLHFAGSPSVLYAAKKAKLPVVMTLHNYRLLCPSATLFHDGKLFTNSVNSSFPFAAVKKGVYQNSHIITGWLALSGWLHQQAGTWNIPAKYIVLGDNAREVFQNSKMKKLADKMVIKPNFCYAGEPATTPAGSYYLFVGRLSDEKGIRVMLGAFKNANITLKIIGDGPLLAEVKAAADVYPNIEFLGAKQAPEVRQYIAGAKALIFPSVWYETFGMVIIEAFSCGVPVIAAAIGEAQHLVQDGVNGLLCKANDESDLLKKVIRFEQFDEKTLAGLSSNALKSYNENFSPKENLAKLSEIYNNVKSPASA